jgi:hypothetical protein
MFKGFLGIVAVSALLSIAPAAAAEMDCTDANMMKASVDMDKMPAGEKKDHGHEGNDRGKGNDGQERHGRLQNAYEQSHGNGNVQITERTSSEAAHRGGLFQFKPDVQCRLLMLWTAPPPARECHECGRC